MGDDSKAALAAADAAPRDGADPPPAYEAAAPTDGSNAAAPPPAAASGAVARPRPPLPLDLPALNELRGKRVILASASPRRRQIISLLGLPDVEIRASRVPEDQPKTLSPFEYALRTAERKALDVYEAALDDPARGDPALVIGADTVVVAPSGDIFEKPRSAAEHLSMLRTLRDAPARRHSVVTGVAVVAPLASARAPGYRLLTAVEETVVVFDRDVTDAMLRAYVGTREGADKAGGYGLQGLGSVLVERIEGSWDNVVGLPLRVTLRLVERCLDQSDDVEDEYAAAEGVEVM